MWHASVVAATFSKLHMQATLQGESRRLGIELVLDIVFSTRHLSFLLFY
jgi:hypothetical protein